MQKRNEKTSEKYKRKIKQRRIMVLSIFILVLVICVCLFTPLFAISEITVTGNSYLAAEDVILTSGIEKGENLFRISGRKAVKALSSLAYVEDADIKRKFLAKIEIVLDEAKQDIIVDTQDEFVVMTMNGRVLEKTEDVTEISAPIVYGLEIANAEIAKNIEPKEKEKFDLNLSYITCFYETDFWNEIDEFYAGDTANFMVIMKSGMKITFGTIDSLESIQRKIKMISQILPQIEQTERSYLDLTTDKGYFGEYTEDEIEEMKRREESGESLIQSQETEESETETDQTDSQ